MRGDRPGGEEGAAPVRSDVGVVLLTYRNADDTLAALASLHASAPAPGRIVVVDNGSEDDTAARVEGWARRAGVPFGSAREADVAAAGWPAGPGVRLLLVLATENHGFAGGINLGARALAGSGAPAPGFLMLLNNDATVARDFLAPALEALAGDSRVAVVGGTIRLMPPAEGVWFAGGALQLLRSRGRHVYRSETRPREITFCTGCYMIVRREAFEDVRGFPECYFLYVEDVEFCRRLGERGWKLMHVPASVVFHKVSATSGLRRERPAVAYLSARNRLWFARRMVDPLRRPVALALVTLDELSRAVGARLRGAGGVSRAIVRGLAHGMFRRWPERGPARPE